MIARFALLLAVLFVPLAAAFEVPENDGFVTNLTDRLTIAQENDVEQVLSAYRKETSNEIAVLLVPTLSGSNIAEASVEVGRRWGVGTEDDNNGILMLISVGDSEMMIATGYGLEGAVPDIVAKGIIEEEIAPHFREGDFHGGILAGIDALKKHIGGEYEASRYDEGEGFSFGGFALFFIFILFDFLISLFGRTKSWWLGGVLGAIFGIVLTVLFTWWITIPLLTALGLLFDYIVSRNPRRNRRGRNNFWSGGTGMGGGSSGGFGGFGGGSFGGGGASGKW